MNIDVKEFKKQFDNEYERLREKKDKVPGFREAVREGDKLICKHSWFVGQFVAYRMDFLSSDREVDAFALAMEKFAS